MILAVERVVVAQNLKKKEKIFKTQNRRQRFRRRQFSALCALSFAQEKFFVDFENAEGFFLSNKNAKGSEC